MFQIPPAPYDYDKLQLQHNYLKKTWTTITRPTDKTGIHFSNIKRFKCDLNEEWLVIWRSLR